MLRLAAARRTVTRRTYSQRAGQAQEDKPRFSTPIIALFVMTGLALNVSQARSTLEDDRTRLNAQIRVLESLIGTKGRTMTDAEVHRELKLVGLAPRFDETAQAAAKHQDTNWRDMFVKPQHTREPSKTSLSAEEQEFVNWIESVDNAKDESIERSKSR